MGSRVGGNQRAEESMNRSKIRQLEAPNTRLAGIQVLGADPWHRNPGFAPCKMENRGSTGFDTMGGLTIWRNKPCVTGP